MRIHYFIEIMGICLHWEALQILCKVRPHSYEQCQEISSAYLSGCNSKNHQM